MENSTSYLSRRYGTGEVALALGVTIRQLQWWDERGIVSVQQEGHHRRYSGEQLDELRLIQQLRKRGITLQKIRNALLRVRRTYGSVANAFDGRRFLLTDAKLLHIHLDNDPVKVCEMAAKSKTPVILIDLEEGARI